ncbi:MAG: GntR family transcriptional regulator [Ruminococcus sp.]|nr:GntR family transcriptional regulator [Ruminococcus sp.]MBP3796974.1 GntR family transcriptional regulator [Ruminococcus sp.]MBQ1433481.1 GntR family transcriptional regulator [Ruminococcus sp.]
MINIDMTGRAPIYEQICKGFGELIAGGVLKENDKLPGARTLAKELGLNPNTVAKAYSRLEHDGIIYSVAGKGCFVAKQQGNIQKKLMENFDAAAEAAIRAGVTAEELKARVDTVTEQNTSAKEGEQ